MTPVRRILTKLLFFWNWRIRFEFENLLLALRELSVQFYLFVRYIARGIWREVNEPPVKLFLVWLIVYILIIWY